MAIKSVLIVGRDGTIGAAVTRLFKSTDARVFTTTRRTPAGANDIFLDLAGPDLTTAKLPETDVAIICAAANGFAHCRSDPDNARRINAEAVRILGGRLTSRGCRVVHLSSSAVFDFTRPHMKAVEPHGARTVYGTTKAAGEDAVLALGRLGTIVRLTKVVAPAIPPLGAWVGDLKTGKSVRAFSDLHFCPLSLDFVAQAIMTIAGADLGGIFQISGAADISYRDAALHLAKRLGLGRDRVVEDRAAAHGIPREEIATFTSLDTSRYASLSGVPAPQPADVLDAVFGPLMRQTAVGSVS